MDNYNFTKGKWSLGDKRKSYQFIDCKDQGWYEMASVVVKLDGELSIEGKANALLISKAPEMLEALKMFVEAVYTEEIIIKENYDNDGHENCGGRLYQKFKQLIKEATEL